MFNKREHSTETQRHSAGAGAADTHESEAARLAANPARNQAAVIGPSIQIDGDLKGEEDLIIEGSVKGTVNLKKNTLTIGQRGKVNANVYAKVVQVDGHMKGDLFASEHINIRKSADVQGNICSPRVSLEDGARFKGSIEMDPEADSLKSAFGGNISKQQTAATSVRSNGSVASAQSGSVQPGKIAANPTA